jgi:hypothetical protein
LTGCGIDTAGNAGPKTLTEARDRIEILEAQLLQLRGSATAAKPASTVPTPTAKPAIATPATPQTPAAIKTGNIVENRGPAEKAPVIFTPSKTRRIDATKTNNLDRISAPTRNQPVDALAIKTTVSERSTDVE